MPASVSQKPPVKCSSNVDATNDCLVQVTIGGSRVDLETIFRAQYGRIARVIAGITRDPARAEELAVEVFLKWERVSTARNEGAEGWLYRTAVRVGLNELRRKTLHRRYENFIASLGARTPQPSMPEEAYSAHEDEQRVRVVLSKLNQRQAELLLLRSNDLSYEEMAEALAINPRSIGTLLSRASAAFRKEFIKQYGEERYGNKG